MRSPLGKHCILSVDSSSSAYVAAGRRPPGPAARRDLEKAQPPTHYCASPNGSSSTSIFLTSKRGHWTSALYANHPPLEAVALGRNRSPTSLEKVTSIPSAWGQDRKRENLTQQTPHPSLELFWDYTEPVWQLGVGGVCGEVVFGLHRPA